MQEKNKFSKFWASRFSDAVICVLLFVFSFLLIYRLALVNFDPHHSGLMYKGALDLAHGKMMFRDTFTQYGALTSYLQALAILVLGESVRSILLSTVFFYAASYVMLYLIARRLLGKLTASAAVCITVFLAPHFVWDFHPWSSVYALFFLMLSLYTLQAALQKTGKAAPMLGGVSGLCAALTFWCRQPVGIVGALAGILCIAFFCFVSRKNGQQKRAHLLTLAGFAVGVTAGVLVLLIPILAAGAGHDFVRQSLSGMVSFASDRSQTDKFGIFGFVGTLLYSLFVTPFAIISSTVWLDMLWFFVPLFPLSIAVLTIVRMILASRKEGADYHPDAKHCLTLIYTVYAVAEWHQYYPVACLRHWFWGAFLCVPAVFLVLRELLAFLPRFKFFSFFSQARWRVLATVLIPLLLFTPNVVYRIRGGVGRISASADHGAYQNEHYTHLNGLYLSPDVADYYDRLFAVMHTLQEAFPDTNVINTTENGIYAVFGENFCPMFNNSGAAYYEEYPAWLEDYINKERPIVIGPEAPNESYVLYCEMYGWDGDVWAAWHNMPAHIYIPAELAAKLPAN